jgi:hypothetical protein
VGVISGQAAERRITLPFEDLLIGGTALQLGFELATHNARDFERIPDLIVKRALKKTKRSPRSRASRSASLAFGNGSGAARLVRVREATRPTRR